MVHPKGSHQGQELFPEPLAGTARAGAGVIHLSESTPVPRLEVPLLQPSASAA